MVVQFVFNAFSDVQPAQLWEKYDVRYDDGRSGFGGEYPVQAGFGWTNGAALDLIRTFYTNTKGKKCIFVRMLKPEMLIS